MKWCIAGRNKADVERDISMLYIYIYIDILYIAASRGFGIEVNTKGRELIQESSNFEVKKLANFLKQEFIVRAVYLNGEGEVMDMMDVADPDAVNAARTFTRKQLTLQIKAEFLRTIISVYKSPG